MIFLLSRFLLKTFLAVEIGCIDFSQGNYNVTLGAYCIQSKVIVFLRWAFYFILFSRSVPNSQASAASSGSSSSNDVGATFWLVLATFLVLLIVLIATFVLLYRRKTKHNKHEEHLSYEPSYYKDTSAFVQRGFIQPANEREVYNNCWPYSRPSPHTPTETTRTLPFEL